jgi:uncharacterized membrane protein
MEAVVTLPLTRMLMAVTALAGALIAGYMLLYKLGVLASIACGTGACESVQASPWSDFLGVPVPLWGVAGYGAIFVAALLGIQPGFIADRRIAAFLFFASTYGFAFSAYLSWIEAVRIHAWCRWCIASAVVATLLFLLAVPELGRMRRRHA